MKNIYLSAGSISEVFKGLENSFEGALNSDDNTFKLSLNTSLTKGKIEGFTFINGITTIHIEMTFFDDVTLSMESAGTSSIVFAYCNGEGFQHSFGSTGHKIGVKKGHSVVLTNNRSINTVLQFHKNTTIQFSLIKVETEGMAQTNGNPILYNLKNTFLNKQSKDCYQGIQNSSITEKLQQLQLISENGMIGHILQKECINAILQIEIDDNTDSIHKLSRAIKVATLNQVNEIKKMYVFIKHYTLGATYQRIMQSKNKIFMRSFLEKI